jgi:hypothetical protein
LDHVPVVGDVMVLEELKAVVDALLSITEYRKARTSLSHKRDSQQLHLHKPRTISQLMHLRLSTSLLSVYKLKIQQLLWPAKIVEQQLHRYGGGTREDIQYVTPVVREYARIHLQKC